MKANKLVFTYHFKSQSNALFVTSCIMHIPGFTTLPFTFVITPFRLSKGTRSSIEMLLYPMLRNTCETKVRLNLRKILNQQTPHLLCIRTTVLLNGFSVECPG